MLLFYRTTQHTQSPPTVRARLQLLCDIKKCLFVAPAARTHLMRRVLVTKELKSYLSEMPPTALSRLDIHPDTHNVNVAA